MTTTRMMAYEMPELVEAEYAFNSDAGGGDLAADGRAVSYNIQAAEKTCATREITVRNRGGNDGMHFRKAGVPARGMSGIFMNPDEMYAHGLNERVPIRAFYDGLDHRSIIIRELASG